MYDSALKDCSLIIVCMHAGVLQQSLQSHHDPSQSSVVNMVGVSAEEISEENERVPLIPLLYNTGTAIRQLNTYLCITGKNTLLKEINSKYYSNGKVPSVSGKNTGSST